MLFVGVDVGLTGAVAAIGASGQFIDVWDMPVEVGRTGKNRMCAKGLQGVMNQLSTYSLNQRFTVEQVAAMPKQGVSSMFNFGDSFGVVRAVIALTDMPVEFVSPMSWKKKMGCVGTDKDYALTLARQYYPAAPLHLKKHIGRADALLIARSAWLNCKPAV
jgi:crossover junction endodeoxyribonuclease RuvC